jgi:rhodanese-related sulfurtransferase
MDYYTYETYGLSFFIIVFFVWKFLKNRKVKSVLPQILAQGAVIIDVRTPQEFLQGSRPGSYNIPLEQLHKESLHYDRNQTIVVCCASGTRSALAKVILAKNGFTNVINAGSWKNTLV